MNNKDLIKQYINTGNGIPGEQFNQLNDNNKTSYLRKMELSVKQDVRYIKYYYGELPEDVQLAAVTQNGNAISYIKNPSEAVQLAAVTQDGGAIAYIDNPSEQVKMEAVKQDGHAIYYIENPSEQVQLAAVTQTGDAIEHIVKKGITPSEVVRLAANQNKN